MKMVDGSVDGEGQIIGDVIVDYCNDVGYILLGLEYFIMFDGFIGKVLDIIDYEFVCGDVNSWGDGYGNCVDCFLVGVVYLDGSKLSLFMV